MELLGDVSQVEGRFGSLGGGVNVDEIGAQFMPNVPWVWKSFWTSQWNSDNVGQMEARFSPFGECVNLDRKLVHGLCQMYHRLRN
jgi:hypothetical protein